MNAKNHETTILSIEVTELYQTINDVLSVLHTGPLNIVYLSVDNSFTIKIKDFTQNLSKDLVVQALIPKDNEKYPSYTLQNNQETYTIKIVKIASPEALSTLETLLNNHCFLYYESDDNVPNNDGDKARETKLEGGPKRNQGLIARFISFGGEMSKAGMVKSAQILGSGVTKAGNFVQNRYIKNPEEKEVSDMTIYKLKAANLATSMTAHATAIPAQGIAYAGKQITKKVSDKILNSDFGSKHHDSIVEVGKSSLYAAACVYDGFTDALSILGSTIADATTKVVTQKYGEQAGVATKEGINVIGNIGKIINAYKEDASRIINEASPEV